LTFLPLADGIIGSTGGDQAGLFDQKNNPVFTFFYIFKNSCPVFKKEEQGLGNETCAVKIRKIPAALP